MFSSGNQTLVLRRKTGRFTRIINMNEKVLLSKDFVMNTDASIDLIHIEMDLFDFNCWNNCRSEKRTLHIIIFFIRNWLERKMCWFSREKRIFRFTLERNDWIKLPLWYQKISNWSKFDRNEHVKRNVDPSLTVISKGELKVDWKAMVFCRRNFSKKLADDKHTSMTIMIKS